MIGSRFIVIFLAAFASNAEAEAPTKVCGDEGIEVKGVEFRPSWKDYWRNTKDYSYSFRLVLTESKYHVLSLVSANQPPKTKISRAHCVSTAYKNGNLSSKVSTTKKNENLPFKESAACKNVNSAFKVATSYKNIKVKALDELEGYYYVVAISKLAVKKRNYQVIWNATCNRNIVNKEKIQKIYPNAIQLILISYFDKDRIQFQCPAIGKGQKILDNMQFECPTIGKGQKILDKIQFQCPTIGKNQLNISLLPDGQKKPWTPRRGKLGLYHLRMRPFRGFQFLFPRSIMIVGSGKFNLEGGVKVSACQSSEMAVRRYEVDELEDLQKLLVSKVKQGLISFSSGQGEQKPDFIAKAKKLLDAIETRKGKLFDKYSTMESVKEGLRNGELPHDLGYLLEKADCLNDDYLYNMVDGAVKEFRNAVDHLHKKDTSLQRNIEGVKLNLREGEDDERDIEYGSDRIKNEIDALQKKLAQLEEQKRKMAETFKDLRSELDDHKGKKLKNAAELQAELDKFMCCKVSDETLDAQYEVTMEKRRADDDCKDVVQGVYDQINQVLVMSAKAKNGNDAMLEALKYKFKTVMANFVKNPDILFAPMGDGDDGEWSEEDRKLFNLEKVQGLSDAQREKALRAFYCFGKKAGKKLKVTLFEALVKVNKVYDFINIHTVESICLELQIYGQHKDCYDMAKRRR